MKTAFNFAVNSLATGTLQTHYSVMFPDYLMRNSSTIYRELS